MIEDFEALAHLDAIAAIDGIDGFFIGRGDLAVSMGVPSMDGPEVRNAVARIAAAAKVGNKTLCATAGSVTEAAWLEKQGVTALIISSDQGFLRVAAAQALSDFRRVHPTVN